MNDLVKQLNNCISYINLLFLFTVCNIDFQGVKFMYDCVMGDQIEGCNGCIMADEMVSCANKQQ